MRLRHLPLLKNHRKVISSREAEGPCQLSRNIAHRDRYVLCLVCGVVACRNKSRAKSDLCWNYGDHVDELNNEMVLGVQIPCINLEIKHQWNFKGVKFDSRFNF